MQSKKANDFIRENWLKLSDREMAEAITQSGLKMSTNAVRKRRDAMGLCRTATDIAEIHISDVVAKEREDAMSRRKDHSDRKKYKHLIEEHNALLEEHEAFKLIAGASETHTITASEDTKTSEATAVALLSDWHVEEQVRSEWVNGINEYNLEIAKYRANQCFQRIARLVKKERQDVSIKELILWFGGDFFSGRIHEELLETAQLGPVEAAIYSQELLQSGLDYLREKTDLNITVVTSVGNHSRITKFVHSATERANSLESFIYYSLAARFKDDKRVKFVIRDSYHTYVEVYDFLCRFHHGTKIRYYSAIGGIHTNVAKYILKANKGIRRPANFDFIGHHHTYLPVATGSSGYIVNGSMIGTTPYGMEFGSEPPRQAFFLIDKRRGLTVTIPILFDT